jgi:hypothetical protein
MDAGQTDHVTADDIQFRQGIRQADRFGETMFGQAARFRRADVGMQDKRACGAGRRRAVAFNPLCQKREIVIIIFRQV